MHPTDPDGCAIRPATAADTAAVRRVHEAAFGRPGEADLVDALRRHGKAVVSLVAELDGQVVGHVLFSPVTVETAPAKLRAVGLAPVAVLPAYQRRGIGAALNRAGLEACRQLGYDAAVVLGHAEYYPRFGFRPASRFGLCCAYDVPDDVFLALELRAGGLAGCRGLVSYADEFATV